MGATRADADEKDEGVMATDFFWSYTDEPHASRRREILAKYPQIKELFGPDPLAFLKIAAVVSLQLWTATLLRDASWLKMATIAYFFGSFLNNNLFLAIHELSHNLAFATPSLNRWLGIFANLPIGVPMPLFLKPKPLGLWEFTNLTIQLTLNAIMVYLYGWKSLAYLILSTFLGGGMHPMAGHFISEHYVFNPEQEDLLVLRAPEPDDMACRVPQRAPRFPQDPGHQAAQGEGDCAGVLQQPEVVQVLEPGDIHVRDGPDGRAFQPHEEEGAQEDT
ncbi:hypothetical protein ACQ4PT_031110 [Festuca glaucescens]